MLGSVDWWLVTDVLGIPSAPSSRVKHLLSGRKGSDREGEECLQLETFDHSIISKVV
jgi:hypothetical protein